MKTTLVISIMVALLTGTTSWARPVKGISRPKLMLNAQKVWYAAKAAVLRPKNSLRTIRRAQQVLKRKVSFGEKVSILAAHGYGVGKLDAKGKIHWKPGVIHKKARFLQSLKQAERKALFKAKVVGWVLVVKRDDYIRGAPYRYNGRWYRNVEAAARAMEREKGEHVSIEVNNSGYVTLPR